MEKNTKAEIESLLEFVAGRNKAARDRRKQIQEGDFLVPGEVYDSTTAAGLPDTLWGKQVGNVKGALGEKRLGKTSTATIKHQEGIASRAKIKSDRDQEIHDEKQRIYDKLDKGETLTPSETLIINLGKSKRDKVTGNEWKEYQGQPYSKWPDRELEQRKEYLAEKLGGRIEDKRVRDRYQEIIEEINQTIRTRKSDAMDTAFLKENESVMEDDESYFGEKKRFKSKISKDKP